MSYTKIGVAGPVGSGKTALIEILIRKLAKDYSIGVITNDIYMGLGFGLIMLQPDFGSGVVMACSTHGRQPYREPSTVSPPQQGQRFSLESISSTIVRTSRFSFISLPTAEPNLSRPQSEPLLLRSRPSRSRFRPSCSSASS